MAEIKTNKDIEKIGQQSERAFGKTLAKTGSLLDKQAKSYSTWKENKNNIEKTDEQLDQNLATSFRERFYKEKNIEVQKGNVAFSQYDSSQGTDTQNKESEHSSVYQSIKTRNDSSIQDNKNREVDVTISQNDDESALFKTDPKANVQNHKKDSTHTDLSHTEKPQSSILNSIKTKNSSNISVEDLTIEEQNPLSNFKNGFLNRHTFDFKENQSKGSKAITVIGKTSALTGKGIEKVAATTRLIDDSMDGNNSGGMRFVENQAERYQRKLAIKTSRKVGAKGLEYGKQGGNYAFHKIEKSVLSKSKAYESVKKYGKIIIESFKESVKVLKTSLLQLVIPTLSAVGVVMVVMVFIVILGASSASSYSPISGDPDFTNEEAWKSPNNPYAPTYYGQCTWFAWGRFYEIYGYSPGFLGNGNQCVAQLLQAHPDKFQFSTTPVPGAVASSDYNHNHVWIVTDVVGDQITIQEGNLNGVSDPWDVAITDWRTITYSTWQLKMLFGDVVYAVPIDRGGVSE